MGLLQELNCRFILGAKPADHAFLFDWVTNAAATSAYEVTDDHGIHHRFRYLNDAPLNDQGNRA